MPLKQGKIFLRPCVTYFPSFLSMLVDCNRIHGLSYSFWEEKTRGNVEKKYSFLYVGMSESGRKCYGNCYQPAHVLTWIDYISCFISMILAHCLWSAEVTGRKIVWFMKVRETFSSGIHSISILSPEMSIWSSAWWLVSSFAQATQDSDREQLNLARLMTSHIAEEMVIHLTYEKQISLI